MSVKTVLLRRHSCHSAGVEKCFEKPVRLKSSQIIMRRPASTYGSGRIQYRIDGAKHRGVDADAERQRCDCDGRERRIAANLAQFVADIAGELLQARPAPRRANVFLDSHRIAESPLCGVTRFIGRQATLSGLLRFQIQSICLPGRISA